MAIDSGSRHVVITGPMGVGKTTLGAELAGRLQRVYRDSDTDIVELFGCPGGEIAAEHGVPCLHEIERAVLLGALAGDTPTVVTAAASVVESPMVRRVLDRRAVVIVLDAPIDIVIARQRADTTRHRRPIDNAELAILLERRAPLLAEAADLHLDAERSPATLIEAVISFLEVGVANDDKSSLMSKQ